MKKSISLWLLVAVFVLPVLVAWLMLRNQWYEGGVTNRGQLVDPPVSFDWLSPSTPQWQLVYLAPTLCEAGCQGAMFNLRQVPKVVGESESRLISRLLLSPSVNHLSEDVATLPLTPVAKADWASLPFGSEAIYIVDPLGNIMMAYPLVEGKEAVLSQGKDIVRDLKRLLKVSKVG